MQKRVHNEKCVKMLLVICALIKTSSKSERNDGSMLKRAIGLGVLNFCVDGLHCVFTVFAEAEDEESIYTVSSPAQLTNF